MEQKHCEKACMQAFLFFPFFFSSSFTSPHGSLQYFLLIEFSKISSSNIYTQKLVKGITMTSQIIKEIEEGQNSNQSSQIYLNLNWFVMHGFTSSDQKHVQLTSIGIVA
ncbi:hypothetical protein H6P81_000184 [Aristolochia fimbriata]|uniref:Uncharacterized protein n=1 Tax=Aristolochia fimbriata TaxID=158543 RepID=A0AAV7F4M3_ARIFI|nr:hypothetical protein H6P81_000184 [Aristolochia fimbriata]